MDPYTILKKYYENYSEAYRVLVEHSEAVTKKALEIAKKVPELKPDLQFIKEAAMLHDIGVCKTKGPAACYQGEAPGWQHGILGREILEKGGCRSTRSSASATSQQGSPKRRSPP